MINYFSSLVLQYRTESFVRGHLVELAMLGLNLRIFFHLAHSSFHYFKVLFYNLSIFSFICWIKQFWKLLQPLKYLDANLQPLELFPLNTKTPVPPTKKKDNSESVVKYTGWQKVGPDQFQNKNDSSMYTQPLLINRSIPGSFKSQSSLVHPLVMSYTAWRCLGYSVNIWLPSLFNSLPWVRSLGNQASLVQVLASGNYLF